MVEKCDYFNVCINHTEIQRCSEHTRLQTLLHRCTISSSGHKRLLSEWSVVQKLPFHFPDHYPRCCSPFPLKLTFLPLFITTAMGSTIPYKYSGIYGYDTPSCCTVVSMGCGGGDGPIDERMGQQRIY